MVQIFDIQISSNIPIRQSFTKIYGIGTTKSNIFCDWLGLPPSWTFNDVSLYKRQSIIKAFEKFIIDYNILIEEKLRVQNNTDSQRLRLISSYRGIRNSQGLPVRGQKTKSNARTQRKRRRI